MRGTVNHFVMACEDDLGELNFVRVWHDNSGKVELAGWFLDKIVIEDIAGKKRYGTFQYWCSCLRICTCFYSRNWISVSKQSNIKN